MDERSEILREALAATGTSQSALARMSGVRQPSISKFLSGQMPFSDEMLERLLACMGRQLHVVRTAAPVALSRSDRMRWALHRQLAQSLDAANMQAWWPRVAENLDKLRAGVQGEPHLSNLDRWEHMFRAGDERGIRHAMTGVDADAIAMREVSPLGGLLSPADRDRALDRNAA